MANVNLRKAKAAKNDEYYTDINDIILEIVQHKDYVEQFYGKTVLCNCDDPAHSAFVELFRKFFRKFKLKKMIATHYNSDGSPSYKVEWCGKKIRGDTVNYIKTPLEGNGDFRSEECIALLDEADIVVTNPPFSLFREYVDILEKHHKDYVIIGNMNAISYKEFFPLIMEGRVTTGYNTPREFTMPDGKVKKFGNICWFTTLDIMKNHDFIPLVKTYSREKYPHYDNYDAIECAKVNQIPKDYVPCFHSCPHADKCRYASGETPLCETEPLNDAPERCSGIIGVPVSYMLNHSPEQFEIVGASVYDDTPCRIARDYSDYKMYRKDGSPAKSGALKDKATPKLPGRGKGNYSVSPNGKTLHATYNRIFIRRRKHEN